MTLALAIALCWAGGALMWVSFHGLTGNPASPGGVLATIVQQVQSAA